MSSFPKGWLKAHLEKSSGPDKYLFIVEQSIFHKDKMLDLVGKEAMLEAHAWYIDEYLIFFKRLDYA